MKILIMSDSHDNVANLEKVLAWSKMNNITTMIHAGDISAPGVLKNTIAPNFPGDIYLITGNVADPVLLKNFSSQLPNVKFLGEEGTFEIAGKQIFLTHFPERAAVVASANVFDLLVCGHSHVAEIERGQKSTIVNPGTVGGLYHEATFAVYDTDNGEVKILLVNTLK